MITLEKSDKWRQRFMEEMYANDDYYEGFIKGDVARAYYFGFFIEEVCKEMEADGFMAGNPDEQLTPIKWNVRRYKPQLVFWKQKFVELKGRMVVPSEMDTFILNKIVVESDDDLLRIATCLGRDSYLLVSKQVEKPKLEI